MTIPEKAVQWALDTANDASHGYDQANRWGPDYDCSSFVITAYQKAGLPVRENGASYTGNMKSAFLKSGFHVVTDNTLKPGDVLLHEKNHTAMYIGSGQIVQASINEQGKISGGTPGDQTGTEIGVRTYYSYPWDCVLRYGDDADADPVEDVPDDRAVSLPLVRRGDVNGAVLSVQVLLINKWAVSCGIDGADGDFGPNTESAVKAFQRHKGLEQDGIVGPQTWKVLLT